MLASIKIPARITLGGAALAVALVALLLSPISPWNHTPSADAFSLGAASDVVHNAGQTLTIGNEDVQLTFVSVSAGFNNEFGRALPAPTTSYFFCNSVSPGFMVDGGRFSGPQELRFYLTTPAQGTPSIPRTWYTGPGSNNSDSIAHARMTQLDATTVRLEWEDLIDGGDFDYNDCVIDIMITPLATITVCKDVVPSDAGATSWSFAIDGPDALSDRTVSNLHDGQCQDEELLTPGGYTVTETSQPAGYDTDVSCDNGSADTDNDVSFNLVGGEHVTCTFTNTLTASIQICKDVQPNDAGATSWNFTVAGPTPGNANGLTDGKCQTLQSLLSGNYTVTETTQPPTHATSVSCYLGNGSSPTNGITFALSPGEQTTCTFVNQTVADIDVLKDFVPDDAANVTISLPVCTSGTVSSTDNTASEADPADFQVKGFAAGASCSISETVPGGYYADQSDCQNVLLTAGMTSSCTMVNNAFASIEICKDVVPDAPFDFDISLSGPTPHDTTLGDGECDSWSDLEAGAYTILESIVIGYQASIDCGAFGVASPGALLGIDIEPGDAVQCAVTNLFVPGPPAVGGIAGLLNAGDAPPSGSGAPAGITWWLTVVVALAVLATASAGAALAAARVRRP